MHNEYIARLTVTEFRRFKHAVRVLVAAGMTFDEAVNTLVTHWQTRDRLRIAR